MGEPAAQERVADEIRRITSVPVIREILSTLKTKLPTELKYHTFEHVREVLHEAVRFAVTDGIGGRELEILAIAAAFHDAGFLQRYENNESVGAEMAEKAMRADGTYTEAEIRLVSEMILDTRVIDDGSSYLTRANSSLSKYLLDADLSNFGREDFFDKTVLVEAELGKSHLEHLEQTYRLFTNHSWLTPAAKTLRGPQKELNQKRLEEMLKGLR